METKSPQQFSTIESATNLAVKSEYHPPFPPLELITKPGLTTREMAYYTNQAEQTWRAHACHETFPQGLRPIRVGGRLNWPTSGVKKLLGVG